MSGDRVAAALPFLVDRSPDGHFLVEPDGTISHANVAAQTALGAEARVLLGSALSRWVPQFDIRPGVPLPWLETIMVAATQDRLPVEIAAIVADDEASGRMWVVFRDVTARRGLEGSVRRHAEELEALVRTRTRDLDEVRARYLRMFDLAPILDFELDSQGAVASANRKVCVCFGTTIDHLVGVPLVDLALPDHRDALAAALTTFREGTAVPFEARLRSRDGATIDVILHPSRPEPSPRAGMRILGLDVTALREAERQVDQSLDLAEAQRSRMERILRGIGEGVVVTDPDGQARMMNSVAERALAVDERFAFGRDLLSEQADVDFVRHWNEFLAGEADVARAELGLGGGRRYLVTFSRVKTTEGRLAACTAVLHDVSAQRRAEQRAREVAADLAQELRSQVLAVRGRVAAVDGAPEMQRMARLVEDFLHLAKVEAGRDPVETCAQDLAALAREACGALVAAAGAFDLKVADGLSPATMDAARTRRALDLLLARAARLTPAGRRVEVELAGRNGRVECSIADAGAADPDMARSSGLFRAAGATSGLDLYLAQRLIETQGGELATETRGTCSVVRVSLPAAHESASRGARPGAAADPLLDDDEFLPEESSTLD